MDNLVEKEESTIPRKREEEEEEGEKEKEGRRNKIQGRAEHQVRGSMVAYQLIVSSSNPVTHCPTSKKVVYTDECSEIPS